MTLYQQRKCAGLCPRCGSPSSETSVLCDEHRRDLAERVRQHYYSRPRPLRVLGSVLAIQKPLQI